MLWQNITRLNPQNHQVSNNKLFSNLFLWWPGTIHRISTISELYNPSKRGLQSLNFYHYLAAISLLCRAAIFWPCHCGFGNIKLSCSATILFPYCNLRLIICVVLVLITTQWPLKHSNNFVVSNHSAGKVLQLSSRSFCLLLCEYYFMFGWQLNSNYNIVHSRTNGASNAKYMVAQSQIRNRSMPNQVFSSKTNASSINN